MRSRHMMVPLAVTLAAAACLGQRSAGREGRARRADSAVTAPAVVASSARANAPAFDTVSKLQQATEAVARQRRGRPAALHGVQFSQETEGGRRFDRIVFEFNGDSVAGYHVAYADKPVRRCGSGEPVPVEGSARLLVRFEPAQAHDQRGAPTPARRELAPHLPVVKDMRLICDFEGQVEWVLGLSARAAFRVTEMTGPPRVAIDVEQPN